MIRILDRIKNRFGFAMTTPEGEAKKEYSLTRLELFSSLITLDLAKAQVAYHRAKLERLEKFISGEEPL